MYDEDAYDENDDSMNQFVEEESYLKDNFEQDDDPDPGFDVVADGSQEFDDDSDSNDGLTTYSSSYDDDQGTDDPVLLPEAWDRWNSFERCSAYWIAGRRSDSHYHALQRDRTVVHQ